MPWSIDQTSNNNTPKQLDSMKLNRLTQYHSISNVNTIKDYKWTLFERFGVVVEVEIETSPNVSLRVSCW